HCIDPNKDFILNPAAWSDPAAGQFGTAAAYYNDYRYARRPSESAGLGRLFRIREHMSFELRAEFFNIFNHAQFSDPNGQFNSSRFGAVNGARDPRIGQLALKVLW
ncbi:MAG: hypothetical protein ACREMY_20595, partial [bacterium]